jgi:hypothetical protein
VSVEDFKAWQRVVGAKDDGRPGPLTFAATVAWLRERGHIAPALIPTEARARVVAFAVAELGNADPERYYPEACPAYVGTGDSKQWCGVFALWCLRRAGLTTKLWRDGVGFAYGYLPHVPLPEPGDVAFFAANQHHAIIEEVGGGYVTLINGNGAGRRVSRGKRPIRDAQFYFSIGRLS